MLKQWSDRKKIVLEPLFKGYVFVQVDEQKKWELMKVSGILNYVHWLGKPAKISEAEISAIRKFLNEFSDVEVTQQYEPNSTVVIKQGVLMNYKGILLEVNGSRAKVKINSMGIQLSAYFDKKNLQVLNKLNA